MCWLLIGKQYQQAQETTIKTISQKIVEYYFADNLIFSTLFLVTLIALDNFSSFRIENNATYNHHHHHRRRRLFMPYYNLLNQGKNFTSFERERKRKKFYWNDGTKDVEKSFLLSTPDACVTKIIQSFIIIKPNLRFNFYELIFGIEKKRIVTFSSIWLMIICHVHQTISTVINYGLIPIESNAYNQKA